VSLGLRCLSEESTVTCKRRDPSMLNLKVKVKAKDEWMDGWCKGWRVKGGSTYED
jgi:hypothetical protein